MPDTKHPSPPAPADAPDAVRVFRQAVLRIITFRPDGFGGRGGGGYLLSQERTEEIFAAADAYARDRVAAGREQMAAAVSPDTLDALADFLARANAEDENIVMGDLPGQLKVLAGLIRGEETGA